MQDELDELLGDLGKLKKPPKRVRTKLSHETLAQDFSTKHKQIEELRRKLKI